MKIKDIVYEEAPVPGQAPQPNPSGQPQMGKVSKVQPGVGGAPGMVSITKPDGSILTVPSNQITTGTDGKMSVNTQPEQNGATQPAPTANGQPNITMGQDLQMAEEPTPRKIPKVSIANPLRPMVMDDGNIKGTLLQPASGDLTPELIAKSKPDFEERYIEANGKKYLALATGTVFKVSPRDFQEITQRPQGQPYAPATGARETNPGQNLDIQYKESINESAEVSRIKFLSGL
jgi:hypothetical protein